MLSASRRSGMSRRSLCAMIASMILGMWPATGRAQSLPGPLLAPAPAAPPTIGGDTRKFPVVDGDCVEVEIGGEPAPTLNCLNRKLKRKIDQLQLPQVSAPLDARSPDTKIGIVNQPALRQQYGTNYGISVLPQRPPGTGLR